MADVSSRLRAAREQAGLTIEDISARTKIKVQQLQAIERGQFERLPGEFFTRAFLKTYARELGLPPDEIAREYDASRRAPEAAPDAAPGIAAPAPARSSVRRNDAAPDASSSRALSAFSPRHAWPALALAVILLLPLVILNRQSDRTAEAGAVRSTGTAAPAAAPVATSGTPQPAPPDRLTMDIAPTAEIWINATADGKRAVYRLVKPGERVKVEARNDIAFRIGNAGAFQYSINGVPGRVLGMPGEVVEFQVTRDNVRTYHR